MRERIRAFLTDEHGATAIEYGLIISLIAVVIIAGLTKVSGGINNTFNTVGNNLSAH